MSYLPPFIKNPISCSDKNNSHSFCKECIDIYLKDNNKCPSCELIFEYKINNEIYNKLNKLSFECIFKNEGCNGIFSYSDYLNHINNCKYNNIKYEWSIRKYNNKNKEFEICGFKGNKEEIEKHFKLRGLAEYKCVFCNEKILQINIEEHFKNNCIYGINKYSNGD